MGGRERGREGGREREREREREGEGGREGGRERGREREGVNADLVDKEEVKTMASCSLLKCALWVGQAITNCEGVN